MTEPNDTPEPGADDAAMLDHLQHEVWPALMAAGVAPLAAAVAADGRPAAAIVISTRLTPAELLDATPRIVAVLQQAAANMVTAASAGPIVPPEWSAGDDAA